VFPRQVRLARTVITCLPQSAGAEDRILPSETCDERSGVINSKLPKAPHRRGGTAEREICWPTLAHIAPRHTYLIDSYGGERGIRTLEALIEAVSYGFVIAGRAVVAVPAVAPCTLLHAARASRRFGPSVAADAAPSRHGFSSIEWARCLAVAESSGCKSGVATF
jgi:hypothetical protein